MGLFFDSIYVFDKYIPTIPVKNICIPETRVIMHTSEVQPSTGSPNNIFLTIISMIKIKDIKKKNKPNNEENIRGFVEKATIPSMA